MTLSAAVLDALLAAGATAEMIVAAVKADLAETPQRVRSTSAIRMARKRERDAGTPEVTHCDAQTVTSDVTSEQCDAVLPLPSSPQTPQLPTPTRGINTRTREVGQVEQAFAAWNLLAKQFGLPIAKALTADRRKAIAARLADGPEAWDEALAGVAKSRHCRGENDRGWKADLDFVCQPKSFNRLREGAYGTDAKLISPGETKPPVPTDPWPGRLREFARNGHWNAVDWGPRPGKPDCRAPPELITEHAPSIAKDRAA